jgi:hypothetical protein
LFQEPVWFALCKELRPDTINSYEIIYFALCAAGVLVPVLAFTGAFGSGARFDASEADFAVNNFKPIPVSERMEKLSSMQYRVTQEAAGEPAFMNAYWNNHEPGIYVDVVSPDLANS